MSRVKTPSGASKHKVGLNRPHFSASAAQASKHSVQAPAAAPLVWQAGRFDLQLQRPLVMGIVNITPDSFSDGGLCLQSKDALKHAEGLLQAGAAILDLGAESSRPGSQPLPEKEELRRLLPVLREAVRWQVPISVDTYKASVMQAALDLGADIINDIWGFRQAGAMQAVAAHPRCGLCVMHMHGEPHSMQLDPMQGDVVAQVLGFWAERQLSLHGMGIASERIALDPGIGFGKTVAQNFALLREQGLLLEPHTPLLVGWSRKSSLGTVTNLPVDQRLVPSTVAAVLAAQAGAHVLRVHDVKETVAALQVWAASLGPDETLIGKPTP